MPTYFSKQRVEKSDFSSARTHAMGRGSMRKLTTHDRSSGPAEWCNQKRKCGRECLEANSGKGSWRGFSESLTPFGKEFEVYYLGNKETIKDF